MFTSLNVLENIQWHKNEFSLLVEIIKDKGYICEKKITGSKLPLLSAATNGEKKPEVMRQGSNGYAEDLQAMGEIRTKSRKARKDGQAREGVSRRSLNKWNHSKPGAAAATRAQTVAK